MKSNINFLSYLAPFFIGREMFQTKLVKKIKTHIFSPVTFFENRAVYEVMWINIVEPDRPQMAI